MYISCSGAYIDTDFPYTGMLSSAEEGNDYLFVVEMKAFESLVQRIVRRCPCHTEAFWRASSGFQVYGACAWKRLYNLPFFSERSCVSSTVYVFEVSAHSYLGQFSCVWWSIPCQPKVLFEAKPVHTCVYVVCTFYA